MLASQIDNTRPKLYRGELFDITITSYNNKFGNEKIKTSFEYGINFPMIYYINELEKIIDKDPSDDKTEKRKKRVQFLKMCNTEENKIFIDLFNNLITYLNGGSMNISNNYNNQPLIVVLAGGNIISIFFNVLKLLLSEESGLDIIFNLFDNEKTSEEFKKLLEQIKYNLKDNSYLRDYLKSSEYQNYSDLDFNLLPNRLDNEWFIYNGGVGEKKRRLTEVEKLKGTSFQEPTKSRKEIMAEKRKLKEDEELKKLEAYKEELEKKEKKRFEALKALKDAKKKGKITKSLAVNKKIDDAKSVLQQTTDNLEDLKEIINEKKKNINEKDLTGFFLCRIKSSFPCRDNQIKDFNDHNKKFLNYEEIKNEIDVLNINQSAKKNDCKLIDLNKLNTIYDKLIAHLAKKDWLKIDVSPECLAFIKKLLSKKLITKKCTDANTLVISRSIFDPTIEIMHQKYNDYYESTDEVNKLRNMIYYIHLITFTINNEILNENNPLYNDYEKTPMNLFDNFFNIDYILTLNDGILLKFIKQIIDKFYEFKYTKTIIKNIQNIYSACGEPIKANYQVYSSSVFSIYRNFIEATLKLNENISEAEPKYDKGTFITINVLKSFKEDELILHNVDESSFIDAEIDYILNDNSEPLTDEEKIKIEKEIDEFIKEQEEEEEQEQKEEDKDKLAFKKQKLETDHKSIEKDLEMRVPMDLGEGFKKKIKRKNILSKIKSKVTEKIKKYKKKRKSKKTKKRFKKFVKKVMRLTKKCKKKKYKNTRKCKKFLQIVK